MEERLKARESESWGKIERQREESIKETLDLIKMEKRLGLQALNLPQATSTILHHIPSHDPGRAGGTGPVWGRWSHCGRVRRHWRRAPDQGSVQQGGSGPLHRLPLPHQDPDDPLE